jgi:hypothetical protein
MHITSVGKWHELGTKTIITGKRHELSTKTIIIASLYISIKILIANAYIISIKIYPNSKCIYHQYKNTKSRRQIYEALTHNRCI